MDLTAILRCPRCRGPLTAASPAAFECTACRVRYKVTEGVPNLTPADAEPLDPASR